jgi:hypothetical protein
MHALTTAAVAAAMSAVALVFPLASQKYQLTDCDGAAIAFAIVGIRFERDAARRRTKTTRSPMISKDAAARIESKMKMKQMMEQMMKQKQKAKTKRQTAMGFQAHARLRREPVQSRVRLSHIATTRQSEMAMTMNSATEQMRWMMVRMRTKTGVMVATKAVETARASVSGIDASTAPRVSLPLPLLISGQSHCSCFANVMANKSGAAEVRAVKDSAKSEVRMRPQR